MILTSSYAKGHPQIDSRSYVTETHVLNVGAPVVVEYLASPDTDYAAVMTARAVQINEDLENQEFDANMGEVLT